MPVVTSTPAVVKQSEVKTADRFQIEQIVILTPRGGTNVVKFIVDAGAARTVTPEEGEPYEVIDHVENLGDGVTGAELAALMDAAGTAFEVLRTAGATLGQAFYGAIKQAAYDRLQASGTIPSGEGVTIS